MRLTKTLKASILEAVMKEAFGEAFTKANAEVNEAVELFLEDYFAAELKAVELIPADLRNSMLVPRSRSICLRFKTKVEGPYTDIVTCEMNRNFLYTGFDYPLQYAFGELTSHYESSVDVLENYNSPAKDRVLAASLAVELLFKQLTAAREQVETLLASVTTDTKLLELAPEMAKYLPATSGNTSLVPIDLVYSVRGLLQGCQHE